jgi:TatA/E family protein of Tat protein translocase
MFEWLFQPMDLLVILIVALLVFGQKLPELGKAIGDGIRGGRGGGPPGDPIRYRAWTVLPTPGGRKHKFARSDNRSILEPCSKVCFNRCTCW